MVFGIRHTSGVVVDCRFVCSIFVLPAIRKWWNQWFLCSRVSDFLSWRVPYASLFHFAGRFRINCDFRNMCCKASSGAGSRAATVSPQRQHTYQLCTFPSPSPISRLDNFFRNQSPLFTNKKWICNWNWISVLRFIKKYIFDIVVRIYQIIYWMLQNRH